MANTYTKIYYHIVFSTKNRVRAITEDRREDLYRYIWGIHQNLKCHLYRIGGVEDHIHLLTSLHPSLALASYIEELKTGSTHWIRREQTFTAWPGWQDGYAAFTLADKDREDVTDYIKSQAEHHRRTTFMEEYRRLLEEAQIQYDPKYLE